MTPEILHRLVDVKILIQSKSAFTPTEAKIIFDLYNEITGEKKVVTTCPACVNGVISRLKKECRNAGI